MGTIIKLLITQETISHYNVPLYEELNQRYDVTVLHSDEKCLEHDYTFKTLYIPYYEAHYKIHKNNLFKIANEFDVVICMFSFSYLYFRLFSLLPRKFKLIYWGIGVSASYKERYDENQRYVPAVLRGISRSDATVFYCNYPVNKYVKLGADRNKLFVANNTVSVEKIVPSKQRDIFLFVGSLYKEKKIDVLLTQYCDAYKVKDSLFPLYIIGDGEEKCWIEKFVANHELSGKVHICGAINDDSILKKYFARAIACISPDQAGLSVLKSMGYGVPFVTSKNAITGGEIFNIINETNGILIENLEELKDVLVDATDNPEKYIKMGDNAYSYYWSKCRITDMADGFDAAVHYVLRNKDEEN